MLSESTSSDRETFFLVARRGESRFRIPMDQIDEVFEIPSDRYSIPGAPAWVLGLVSHHGQAVLLLDTAEFTSTTADGKGRQAVLMKIGEDRLGLVVDWVEAMDRVEEGSEKPHASPAEEEILDRNRLLEQIEKKLAGVDLRNKA